MSQAKIILKPKEQEGAMEGLQTRKVVLAFKRNNLGTKKINKRLNGNSNPICFGLKIETSLKRAASIYQHHVKL